MGDLVKCPSWISPGGGECYYYLDDGPPCVSEPCMVEVGVPQGFIKTINRQFHPGIKEENFNSSPSGPPTTPARHSVNELTVSVLKKCIDESGRCRFCGK